MNKAALTIDRSIIDQLEKAPLFSMCGGSFEKDLPPFIIKQVASKEEAKNSISLINWENFNIEGLNINSKIPILFLHMLPLYQAGHIPCGWRGPIERQSDRKAMDLTRGILLIY